MGVVCIPHNNHVGGMWGHVGGQGGGREFLGKHFPSSSSVRPRAVFLSQIINFQYFIAIMIVIENLFPMQAFSVSRNRRRKEMGEVEGEEGEGEGVSNPYTVTPLEPGG